MGMREDFLAKVRRKEYDEALDKINTLHESMQDVYDHAAYKAAEGSLAPNKIRYSINVAKKVMCECFTDLYLASIPIDDTYQYEKSLREAATEMIMNEMADIKTMKQFRDKFKNTSPYIRSASVLAESMGEVKAKEIETVEELPKDVILDADDKKIIEKFDKAQGKQLYADELQDRVVDVYKAEKDLADKNNEKIKDIVTDLSNNDNPTINENALNMSLRVTSNDPNTLFSSIFMNKSRAILNESGAGADIASYADDILVETLCTYTLLECIHSTGIKTFDLKERDRLKSKFRYAH